MAIKQTTNEGLKRGYVITLTAAEIAAKIEGEIKKIAPQVKMPGFRPGKVPANLVKKMHGEQIHGQTVNDMIRESVDGLIADEGLRPAMQPAVSLGEDYAEGKDAAITVELEVLPEVEAPSTDGLKLEKLTVPVSDEALEEAIANIAGSNKSYKDAAKTKKAADGNQLIIDFVGKLDGEEFEGGKAEDAPLVQARLFRALKSSLWAQRPAMRKPSPSFSLKIIRPKTSLAKKRLSMSLLRP
jgi:trigger factor